MKFKNTPLCGIFELIPDIFEDERGFFYESFNKNKFNEFLKKITFKNKVSFVQDNYSKSKYGVLRGLHYQKIPFSQAKLVRVVSGKIFDVVVNINKSSSQFGKYYSTILSDKNNKMIWIPEGFAHGFLTMEENTKVLYKTSKYYKPDAEVTIKWNDTDLNITWPFKAGITVGNKDKNGIKLSQVI